jgi:glycosyltransferase involved in cell wall biosynthesis
MTSDTPSNHELMLSVIVPVYNVAPFIEEGLRGIVEQNFDHAYEVILIDDCSTDGSIEICRQATLDYPEKIRLVESEVNSGVSVARNLGLDSAQGRYIIFFDPDDILPPTALASLFAAIEQFDADIVKGNLVLFDENYRRPAPDQVHSTVLVTGDAVLTELYDHARVRGHIGGKMYRRDKFGAIRFPVGVRMAQDLLFFSQLFSEAQSLVLLNSEVYDYRKHLTGSTGSKYEKGSYLDWLGAVEKSGRFASGVNQKRAHKGLLVRTMAQIARECRKIPPASASPVLATIEQKCQQWNIRLFDLIVIDRLGLRGISRYIKMQLALRQIRRNLSRA